VWVFAASAHAQEEDPNLAGTVSALTGQTTITLQDESTQPLDYEYLRVFFDEKLDISAESSAWLFLREKRGVCHLEAGSSAKFIPVMSDGQLVSLCLVVHRGRATLLSPTGDNRRLVLSDGSNGGYAVLRGGSAVLDVSDAGSVVTAVAGEVLIFKGAMPEGGPMAADGSPVRPPDVTLAVDERVDLSNLMKSPAVVATAGAELYAMGLERADRWVESAEQGDFTPQRVEARGIGESFIQTTSADFSYDQPRAPTVLTTRSATPIVTNIRANPAEALVSSGVPSEVVLGTRFLRTRIIGTSGAGGTSISVNQFARPPIDLD